MLQKRVYINVQVIGERARHSLGVLNANLHDIYMYIYMYVCMEVRMSPLSVERATHYVKEAELGHSHFFRSAAYGGGRS